MYAPILGSISAGRRGAAAARLTGVVFGLPLVSACAAGTPMPQSSPSGGPASVEFVSDPPDAAVEIGAIGSDGAYRWDKTCVTPCVVSVPAGAWHLRAFVRGEEISDDVTVQGGSQRIAIEGTNVVARDLGGAVALLGAVVAGYGVVSWIERSNDCQHDTPYDTAGDGQCPDRNAPMLEFVLPGVAAGIAGVVVYDRSRASVTLTPGIGIPGQPGSRNTTAVGGCATVRVRF